MVVQIGKERVEFGCGLGVHAAPLDGADHLAHGQHHAPKLDKVLTHQIGATLQASPGSGVVEQRAFEILHCIVEGLHRVEVAVDDHIEQLVNQGADAVPLRVDLIPATGDLFDVEKGDSRTVNKALGRTNAEMRCTDSADRSRLPASESI